jgi:glycosyltransferase involved in cell wall biosynthesis
MEKILIATDAWYPQVNGVVTTLTKLKQYCPSIEFITPAQFHTYSLFFYPEIKLAFPSQKQIDELIKLHNPHYIHIATEGPIGFAVRKWCIRNKFKFTTSYHTRFPEYLYEYYKIPMVLSYSYLRYFHNKGCGTMVATPSMSSILQQRGFKSIIPWNRGVSLDQFYPIKQNKNVDNPIFLYVGRVSKEKNIQAFLELDIIGHKVVVGDGPELKALKAKYKDVEFTGKLVGSELSKQYQRADVFVFPSKSDTFGLVMLEALACGLPVAAFPVPGPIDILNSKVGCMDVDLKIACQKALMLKSKDCISHAKLYDWKKVTDMFVKNVREGADK